MNYAALLAYIVGILILLLIGRALFIPMKIILRLVYNALLGGIIIVIINFVGKLIGFKIALNIVNALIVGMLGVPGLILIIILKFIFKI